MSSDTKGTGLRKQSRFGREEDCRVEICEAGTLRMRYLTFGRGERTLVILPGLSIGSVTAAAKSIVSAYACFAEDFTVYLFDRREDLPEVYPVAGMARDTCAVFDALGLRELCLYGVSQGGMIAQQIALDRPELVRALVLSSTAARFDEESAGTVLSWLDAAKHGRKRTLGALFTGALYTEEFQKKYGMLLRLSMLKATKKDIARFVTLAEGTRGFSTFERLRSISCPCLVLGAETDRVIPVERQRELARELRAESYFYPAPYGHAVYDEAPDFKKRIFDFLMK